MNPLKNMKIISKGTIKGTISIGDKKVECDFQAILIRRKEKLPSVEELLGERK